MANATCLCSRVRSCSGSCPLLQLLRHPSPHDPQTPPELRWRPSAPAPAPCHPPSPADSPIPRIPWSCTFVPSYGRFRTVPVGRRTARNAHPAGVGAPVLTVAAVATVTVTVVVTAAVPGGQCHPVLPPRLFLLRLLPSPPAPAPCSPPLPADSRAGPRRRTSRLVDNDGRTCTAIVHWLHRKNMLTVQSTTPSALLPIIPPITHRLSRR